MPVHKYVIHTLYVVLFQLCFVDRKVSVMTSYYCESILQRLGLAVDIITSAAVLGQYQYFQSSDMSLDWSVQCLVMLSRKISFL